VLGVPGTYPVEKINGIMISGFASPLPGKITPDQVYPEKIYPLVKDWGYGGINESNVKKRLA
jgi:predicted AlkP superfamily phosphohydrolase/phosphomutase